MLRSFLVFSNHFAWGLQVLTFFIHHQAKLVEPQPYYYFLFSVSLSQSVKLTSFLQSSNNFMVSSVSWLQVANCL